MVWNIPTKYKEFSSGLNSPKAVILTDKNFRVRVNNKRASRGMVILDPYLIMLRVKRNSIKYHFLSLWYDSTWDQTLVSEQSTHLANSVIFQTTLRIKVDLVIINNE